MSGTRSTTRPIMLALSFLLSLFLFAYVKSQEAPSEQPDSQHMQVPLRLENVDPEYYIDNPPESIDVVVEGTGAAVERVRALREMFATIDLVSAKPGTSNFKVLLHTSHNPDVKYKLTQPSIRLTLEPIETVTKEVVIETAHKFSDENLEYLGANASPAKVSLTGPASLTASAKPVVRLDLASVPKKGIVMAKLEIRGPDGGALAGVRADVDEVAIQPNLEERPPEKDLYVNVAWKGQVAPGYRVIGVEVLPKASIRVVGKSADLAMLSQTQVTVDVTGLTTDKTFKVTPDLNRKLRIVGRGVLQVRVSVAPMPPDSAQPQL